MTANRTFTTNDTKVSDILRGIEQGTIQLPEFQRGWVWDDERIRALIASISNCYPVGALMFLKYGADNVRFKYRPFTSASANRQPDILVLDGQQRLTSIFCAMYSKEAVPTQTNKREQTKRYYYLDIDLCVKSLSDKTIDRVDAVVSVPEDRIVRENFNRDIKLDLSSREKEFAMHMLPLNIVYDPIAAGVWMDNYRKYHKWDNEILERLLLFNAEIIIPIQTYMVPVITLDQNTPKAAVCQVFENVNTGGVSLTVFELVTASFAAEEFDLRADWYGDEEQGYKGRFERKKMKEEVRSLLSVVSDVDFLVAITLLSRYYLKKQYGDNAPAVSCKKQDVLNLALTDYKIYADALTDGFVQAASFLVEQRIFSARDLPYTAQLIPLSVLFAVLGNRAHDVPVRQKLSQWYWCGVLGEMYGAANETRFANDVTGVLDWLDGKDEPDTVARAYFQPARLLSLQPETVPRIKE